MKCQALAIASIEQSHQIFPDLQDRQILPDPCGHQDFSRFMQKEPLQGTLTPKMGKPFPIFPQSCKRIMPLTIHCFYNIKNGFKKKKKNHYEW
jgi:hypothetical protein